MKTFEAFTMRDALKAVKSHFGQDAVILSSKEKKIEGAKGKLIEVTAARSSKIAGATQSSREASLPKEQWFEIIEYVKGLERSFRQLAEDQARRSDLQRLDAGLDELRSLVFQELVRRPAARLENMPAEFVPIWERLQVMNVDEAETKKLQDYLSAMKFDQNYDLEQKQKHYQSYAIRWLMKRIKIASPWNPIFGEKAIHVLVGSAGSGKTSSAAKIAHYYKKEGKQKILLVSYDQKRIAAREQLRVLSKVLDLPYESIERASDLSNLLDKNREWDLVIVDSSSACPRREDDLSDLLNLKDLDLPLSFHVCLALTEKEKQMDRMIRGFTPLGIKSLVFSRLDESWSYGEIFNLSHRWSLPLSFFGLGSSIPDDLERASRERVIERIFGL